MRSTAFTDDDLRDAASHRGLKLVKSRKRKPGVGDYGLFGLSDAAGEPLFGISEDGLTATPEQIIDYLRNGEVSTWAASAKSVPDQPRPTKIDKEVPADRDILSAIRPRMNEASARSKQGSRSRRRIDHSRDERATPDRGDPTKLAETVRKAEVTSLSKPQPTPEQELVVRRAHRRDAEQLRRVLAPLGTGISAAALKRAISGALSRREPMLVAEKGELVGSLAWHIIPDPTRGDIARITLIFVAEEQRRHGVGRRLYEVALDEIRDRDAVAVEAMSAIEVRNANSFYRAIGLEQASYRFVAEL